MVELDQVAERCLGKMLDAQKNKGKLFPYLRNPNVRWFEVDLSDLRTMPFEDHELDRYGVRDGDVLICEGGEAGRAAIWDGRIAELKIQKAIHRVRTGSDLFNRYLVHKLKADCDSGRLADYYTGATIKHLTGQDLGRYRFALPPIAEQRRIAEVLDRAETLRAQRRQTLAQLDALAEAIFVDMFGVPETNSKGWQRVTIADIAEQVTDGEHLTPKREPTGIKLLSARNVKDGYLDFGDVDYVGLDEYLRITRRCKPVPGDVLISCSGTIGRVATVESNEPIVLVRSVA